MTLFAFSNPVFGGNLQLVGQWRLDRGWPHSYVSQNAFVTNVKVYQIFVIIHTANTTVQCIYLSTQRAVSLTCKKEVNRAMNYTFTQSPLFVLMCIHTFNLLMGSGSVDKIKKHRLDSLGEMYTPWPSVLSLGSVRIIHLGNTSWCSLL